MSDVFTSVVLVTFPSEVQYDNWLMKFRTFYNNKAMEFLHDNGQISQRASRVQGDDVIRITIIWTYRDSGKVGGKFIAKAPGCRGYEVWSDSDVTSPE